MRIALFSDTYWPELNGVANSTHILKEELKKRGHQVFVVTTYKGSGQAKWDEDEQVLRLAGMELKSLYGYVLTTPFHMHALDEIRKLNLDIIHVQTEFGVGIFAKIVSQQLRIPLVRTIHTTYEDYTHYINFINSKTVDIVAKRLVSALSRIYGDTSLAVIVPSEKTKQLIQNYGVKTDVFVVPTGLHLEQFNPQLKDTNKVKEIREQYGFSLSDRVIIYVGRVAEEKSIDIVIDGFAQAVNKGASVKLLIVGGGPDFERLKEMAQRKGLSAYVAFAGPIPSEEIPDYYHCADAFVSASLSETQGMTFIEALASGLPIFARKDEVLDDLIVEQKTGWYFKDAEDFGNQVLEFERIDRKQIQEMSQYAVQQARPFNAAVFAEKIESVYTHIIEDFQNLYFIDDVRVKQETVQIYLISNSGKDELRLKLSIDDYYEEGLRRGGVLTRQQLAYLKKREAGADAYQKCLRRIAAKDRTRKEIYDWLTQNTECDITTVNQIVSKLEKNGYIDDRRYCQDQIDKMNTALYGREKIIRDLKKKGLSVELIEETINQKDDEEYEKAKIYAKKILRSKQKKSLRQQKETLRAKLMERGFTSDTIEELMQDLDFTDQENSELDHLRACVLKARRRYEKKYSGYELRNRIYGYCASQGFQTADIYAVLDEMEWKKDDEDQ